MYEAKDISHFIYDYKLQICTIVLKDKRKFNYRMDYDKFKNTYHNFIKKIHE